MSVSIADYVLALVLLSPLWVILFTFILITRRGR